MELAFSGAVFEWRGPSPYYYVRVSTEAAEDIREVAAHFTYGWGVVPVRVRIGETGWRTSLFPRDDGYLVPLKADVRRRERIDVDDVVQIGLALGWEDD